VAQLIFHLPVPSGANRAVHKVILLDNHYGPPLPPDNREQYLDFEKLSSDKKNSIRRGIFVDNVSESFVVLL
jgi:hypothetical protein